MPGIVIVGTQWGDEGKGKIVDALSSQVDMVVRYQGGNNAGHTVVLGKEVFKFHLLPSGVIYPHVVPVIAAGVVVDLEVLFREIDELERRGYSAEKLVISGNAHLVMPYHRKFDALSEKKLGKQAIGTTRRGIGPTYADKAARIGIRVQDLLDEKIFCQKLEAALKEKNRILTKVYGEKPFSVEEIVESFFQYRDKIEKRVVDSSLLINQYLDEGKTVLFESAQGTFLDLDYGTYPFVTSSNPIAGGACVGAGVPPKKINKIIGITKAYVTRVGSGPFPTEDFGPEGETLARLGMEYGTTTGRKRRCGWLDIVLLKYAAMLNGLDFIALTKLDVLSAFEKIKICVAYEYQGKTYEVYPLHQSVLHKCRPIYEEIDGWQEDISKIKQFDKLPKKARDYVKRIEKLVGIPVVAVSVGQERQQILLPYGKINLWEE